MIQPKALSLSVLTICCLCVTSAYTTNIEPCKPIEISVDMETDNAGKSIVVDLKGKKLADFIINLIKPRGQRELDARTLHFRNLDPGQYIVVVTGRSEDGEYCPTYVNVSIK